MKAILELDMPDNCEVCPLSENVFYADWLICKVSSLDDCACPDKGRRDDCPLKPVESLNNRGG